MAQKTTPNKNVQRINKEAVVPTAPSVKIGKGGLNTITMQSNIHAPGVKIGQGGLNTITMQSNIHAPAKPTNTKK